MIEIHLEIKDKLHQQLLARELILINGSYREICVHDGLSNQERQEILNRNDSVQQLWLVDKAYQTKELCGYSNILWMSEVPTIAEEECFCYQPVEKIQRQIIKALYIGSLVEEVIDQKKISRFVYLYSPIGGIGVSSIAYELAVELAQKEKVLLLSMDSYHVFAEDLFDYHLSDFLFYWKTLNKVEIRDFCQIKQNLHILHGPKYPEDLEILKSEPKKKFLDFIQKYGYDKVIFDLSSSNMLAWCKPESKYEKLFVIQRPSGKWQKFIKRVDFEYQSVSVEQGVKGIIQILRRKTDVDDIISPNYRRK